MIRFRRTWKTSIVLALIAWLIYAMWPRPFEVFTSDPIDQRGTQIQLLIPRGWTVKSRAFSLDLEHWVGFTAIPPDRPAWWPAFLKRLFPPANPKGNSLMLGLVAPEDVSTVLDMLGQQPPLLVVRHWGDAAKLVGGPIAFNSRPVSARSAAIMIYMREDHGILERTKSVIFGSFRLVPRNSLAEKAYSI